MSNEPNSSILDSFLQADAAGRTQLCPSDDSDALAALIQELEALLTQDAAKTADAAQVIADFAQQCDQQSLAARALRAGATATAYLGLHPAAIELTKTARTIAQNAGDPVEAARALVARMQPLCEMGSIADAVNSGEQAREELLASGQPQLAARVDLNLGNIRKIQGEAERALEHLSRVIETLPENDPIQPHALNAIGECRFVLDDLVGADEAFEQAATILGSEGGLARAIIDGNRADVAAREGRLQDAISWFSEARKTCTQLQANGHAARLVIEAAEALETGGLFDEALSELESALPTLEDASLAFETARAVFAIGRITLKKGQVEASLDYFDNATRRFNGLENQRLANRALLAAVEACIALGRNDEAAVRLAIVSKSLQGNYEQATYAHHEGLLHEAEGRLEAALASANRASEFAHELGVRPFTLHLEARRAVLLRRTGATQEAIETAKAATSEVEQIRGNFQGDRLRAGFLASHIAAHEAYVAALLQEGGPDNVRLAFEVVEQARNRGLIERISRQLSGSAPGRQETAEIIEIRKRLNALYASLAEEGFEDQRRLRTNQRQKEIDQLELQLDRALLDIDHERPPIDAPVSLEEIQASISDHTALLEFFVSEQDLIVFTLKDEDLRVTQLSNVVPEVEQLVSELHFQCRRRLRGMPGPDLDDRMLASCQRILRELYDLIIRPLPQAIQHASRWLAVGHGPLVAIPFHALLDEDDYVIDRTVVTTAPSAAAVVRLRQTKQRGTGTLIATVGDDIAPAIRDEGLAVAELHAQSDSVIRIEDSAVTAKELAKYLAKVRIAHIACHGRFLASSPRSSGLRLADRWFTVRDVHELSHAPSVVILSGCETGLHPREGADELLGLTRGFAAGGSRAVVASLWSIHDAASTRLMTAMHKQLLTFDLELDLPVADALHVAQLELRKTHPHPAFWAPFFCSECPAKTQPDSVRSCRETEEEILQ